MSKIMVRPTKKGLKVPFPMSQRFLNEEGEMVHRSSYWIRRMKEGDVEEVKADNAKSSKSKKTKEKSTSMEVES